MAPGSAAFDYFERGSIGESSRIVPGTTWLSSRVDRVDAPIYEHATAVPGLGAVFSLLWLPPAENVTSAQGT